MKVCTLLESKGCRKLPDVPARWQVRLAWFLSQGNTKCGARGHLASTSLARNPTSTQKHGQADEGPEWTLLIPPSSICSPVFGIKTSAGNVAG